MRLSNWCKMPDAIIDRIKDKIIARHCDDNSQLNVIFSPQKRLLVEAPAGYGKTNTMVSKIAYMLATRQIPYPKRILALTFSVNAAYKMKKDVSSQIPDLLKDTGVNLDISEKIAVSNYHGFCRNVLRKYGYLLHPSLPTIDKLLSVDDGDAQRLMQAVKALSYDDALALSEFSEKVKTVDSAYLRDHFHAYNSNVTKNVLSQQAITYNAVLTLTLALFLKYPTILEFYNRYFTAILVDEFQDTNILSYSLLTKLISDKATNVILLGDSLQRIYGFIGAVPNLMSISQEKFKLKRMKLEKNHRFSTNPEMLQLDYNIRRNAENPAAPVISQDAHVDVTVAHEQEAEALAIVDTALKLLKGNPASKVAVLVRQRGPNTNVILDVFDKSNTPYFFALFTDEDPAYIQFHATCLSEFMRLNKTNQRVTKSLSRSHIQQIRKIHDCQNSPLYKALDILLALFWAKIFTDYSFITNDEKVLLIKDTFEYNGLRQYVEFTNASIVISTVHAAKGLEWDYILIPDMEQNRFPGWYALCSKCARTPGCALQVVPGIEREFLEELSVFYVAVTRARRQVRFTASETSIDSYGNPRPCNLSCFLRLPGLSPNID